MITPETIQATREHFATIYRNCIEHAKSGKYHVNDLERYIALQEAYIQSMLNGESDHTFTFRQCAQWLQTGECVAFLPMSKEVTR